MRSENLRLPLNPTNKKASAAKGMPQLFKRPTVAAPQIKSGVAQLKTPVSAQSVKRPVAPPVYRPQPGTRALQTKSSSPPSSGANQKPRWPVAPPVYRPAAKTVQPKVILQLRKAPTAPPVYRPEQKGVAQPKIAAVGQARTPPKAPLVYGPQLKQMSGKPNQLAPMKLKTGPQQQSYPQAVLQKMHVPNHFRSGIAVKGQRVVSRHFLGQPKPVGRGAIQRAIAPMDDETLEALSGMHALGRDKEIGDSFSEEEIRKMKDGTYLLTGFHGAVNCNCFGWALGQDLDTGDKGSIYRWKKEHGGKQNFTDADSESAKIILWGDKEGQDDEDKWDVTHASVKLTHAELLSRSGRFKGLVVTKKALKDSGIADPFWSSAGGMGYGIFVHPRDWFEGGNFGVALKGMKAAI
jgi:hypothetical protein